MTGYHIHINGLVQGVGFRPFVCQLARRMNINGLVNNATDGVHIEISCTENTAQQFYQSIISNPPPLAVIQQHSISLIDTNHVDAFKINESKSTGHASLMLTPDYAMCSDCKRELHDKNNRRYRYPFITCTQCGPRYSIIQQLPYDRINTSMNTFAMCAACTAEYNNPTNRRHYSQTNSCHDCGVTMQLFSSDGKCLLQNNEAIIRKIISGLQHGKIMAVKGIGGYLLMCDAASKNVVQLLRTRKHRPSKPFALMYPSIEKVEEGFFLDDETRVMLQSPASPIILLLAKDQTHKTICTQDIAPGLSKIGVMLPYTPLFELILSALGKPVIATSGNISEASLVYDDKVALKELSFIADFIVTNNREIVVPQDDSVLQFSQQTKTKIIHRRSRGLAPSFFGYTTQHGESILTTGALLKSSFSFSNNKNVFISQYLGNTDSYEAQQSYEKLVQLFLNQFNASPQVVVADKHPDYFSHQFAKQVSNKLHIPIIEVQHHKAHFAAVLTENNLLHTTEPVLGVIWDGTGLGDDGNIWGGEFFIYQNNEMLRCYHFGYFPVIAGDKMAKEPRLSVLAVCYRTAGMADNILKDKFTQKEWDIYQKLLQKQNPLNGSAVGRIFDAVACLLNLIDKQTYEGEAAMLLEEKAFAYFQKNGWDFTTSYFTEGIHYKNIHTGIFISNIITDIKEGLTVEYIAAKFHYSLVHLIGIIAGFSKIKKITFSGGVFQNSVLVDLCKIHLSKTNYLFFHRNLSPNDENISFGQMVYYENNITSADMDTQLQEKFITHNS